MYENCCEISIITTAQNTLKLPGGILVQQVPFTLTAWLSWLSSAFGAGPFLHFYKPHLSSFCEAYLLRGRNTRFFFWPKQVLCHPKTCSMKLQWTIVGTNGGVNGGLHNPETAFPNDLQLCLSLQFINSYELLLVCRLFVCHTSWCLWSTKLTCWLEHQPKIPLLKGLGITADEFSLKAQATWI